MRRMGTYSAGMARCINPLHIGDLVLTASSTTDIRWTRGELFLPLPGNRDIVDASAAQISAEENDGVKLMDRLASEHEPNAIIDVLGSIEGP